VLKILAGFGLLFLVSYAICVLFNWADKTEVKQNSKPNHIKKKWW